MKNLLFVCTCYGQKRSNTAQITEVLRKKNVLQNTIIVAATASDPAPLQFLAPYGWLLYE